MWDRLCPYYGDGDGGGGGDGDGGGGDDGGGDGDGGGDKGVPCIMFSSIHRFPLDVMLHLT